MYDADKKVLQQATKMTDDEINKLYSDANSLGGAINAQS